MTPPTLAHLQAALRAANGNLFRALTVADAAKAQAAREERDRLENKIAELKTKGAAMPKN